MTQASGAYYWLSIINECSQLVINNYSSIAVVQVVDRWIGGMRVVIGFVLK